MLVRTSNDGDELIPPPSAYRMTDNELKKLLDTLQYIHDENKRDEATQLMLKSASESITLERLKNITGFESREQDNEEVFWKFSAKEISSMPKTFRKEFRTEGCTAHVRKRRSGKNNWNYEIRYRRNGYNITVSSNYLDEAKRKFIEKLHYIDKHGTENENAVPSTMDAFSMYFFENFHKRKVVQSTYRIALNQYKNHVLPHFGDMPIKKITPKKCQELLDKIDASGIYRTTDDIFSMLNVIFKAAVKHALIEHNPMDMVFHKKHEREHGTALSKDEERKLLDTMKGTPYELMFAVALYTGMRPNEYKTAYIENGFIVANNSKQKNGKVELKKIPITPMLARYVKEGDKLSFTRLEQIRHKFKEILPDHKLYDLRTTFYTRCTECGIADVAIKKYAGHTLGGLADTYTDLSDEFLMREGQKLNY